MSDERYRIQKIGPAEFDLLLPLMKDCFGLTVDMNYFRWKYTQNPAGDFIGFVAVEKETGEVGAYYGVIPELYVIDGKEIVIYQSCDTMTHSIHRRRGLFQLLALHCYDHLEQEGKLKVFGFGGGQSTPGFIKFGWIKLFNLVVVFYPRVFNLVSFLTISAKEKKKVIKIDDPSELEELIIESNADIGVHHAKKINNFSWRISNPMHAYQLLGYKNDEGVILGYLVYYIEGSKIFLFDWYFRNRNAERVLMRTLKRVMAADRSIKGVITMIRRESPSYRVLRRNWFIYNLFKKGPLKERTPFIVFSRETDPVSFLTPKSWNPMPYDHDSL